MLGGVKPELLHKAQAVGQYIHCHIDVHKKSHKIELSFSSEADGTEEFLDEMVRQFVPALAQQLEGYFAMKGSAKFYDD